MKASLKKYALLSVLLSVNAVANTELLLEGEFSKNSSDEARFTFLQYEHTRSLVSDSLNSDLSTCSVYLEMDRNRFRVNALRELKAENHSHYRDRAYCSYIMTHPKSLNVSIETVNSWVENNHKEIEYLNSHAVTLENIIFAIADRGSHLRLCKALNDYSITYKMDFGVERSGAKEFYNKECLDFFNDPVQKKIMAYSAEIAKLTAFEDREKRRELLEKEHCARKLFKIQNEELHPHALKNLKSRYEKKCENLIGLTF